MKTVHFVVLKPHGPIDGMRRLLKWKATRGVPLPNGSVVRELLESGMLGEIDDADLEEARTFCRVEVVSTKEVTEEDGG